MTYGMKEKKSKKGNTAKNMTYTGMGNTMPMGRASYHTLSSGKRTARSA